MSRKRRNRDEKGSEDALEPEDEIAEEVASESSAAEGGAGAGRSAPREFDADAAGTGPDAEVDERGDLEGATISAEIEEELAELEELRERHLRLAAEFDNYKKRTRRQLLECNERAEANLAGRLLDVLDDLGRFADLPAEQTTVEALHEGVGLVERKLLKVLQDSGLEEIEAEGERFDPRVHDALLSIPTDEPEEDDTVSQVILTGYKFGDRLLRPARVVVKNLAGTPVGEGPHEPAEGSDPDTADGGRSAEGSDSDTADEERPEDR